MSGITSGSTFKSLKKSERWIRNYMGIKFISAEKCNSDDAFSLRQEKKYYQRHHHQLLKGNDRETMPQWAIKMGKPRKVNIRRKPIVHDPKPSQRYYSII